MSETELPTAGEKNKRVLLNIITSLSYQAVVIVFGLLLPRLYLVKFGSDVNGLDSTIKNIFAYLALLEAGVGLSAQHALYRPVAKGQRDEICAVLSAERRYYLRSGAIYALLTFAFAAIYPLVIKTELDYLTVFAVVILYGIPGIVLFLLRGKYNAFMEVEGKKYILTTLATLTLAFSNILRLVFFMFTDDLILIQATYCLPSIIQVFFISLYVRKKYKWIDWKAKPNYDALSKKRSVLVHQISGCIFSNTDTIIISVMCGMNYASVYAVFSLFFSNLQKLVTSFTDSLTFRLGQLYHTDEQGFNKLYSAYSSIYYMLLFACYTVVCAFLMPIIRLYTSGVEDAALYDNVLVLFLFAAVTVFSGTEIPLQQLLNIAGRFDETKGQAVTEMSINIIVSLIATYKLGVVGCLIGTIVALIYRNNALILYVERKILSRSPFSSYKRVIMNFLTSVVILYILGTESCTAMGYIGVILDAALNAVWILAVFFVVNIIVDGRVYISAYRELKTRIKTRRNKIG